MNLAALIRDLGRGQHGSRNLSEDAAADLYGTMLDGHVPEMELGAIHIALRMKGEGPYAEMIARRFALATKRLNLNRQRSKLRTDLFRPPVLRKDPQLSLFADSA